MENRLFFIWDEKHFKNNRIAEKKKEATKLNEKRKTEKLKTTTETNLNST